MKRLLLLSLVSFAFCFAKGQALQLTRPTNGDVWPAFSVQRIQWQFANVDNIKIEVSVDSARTWTVLESFYAASAAYYDWKVANKPSDSCFIRISDVTNPSVKSSNYPNDPFRIPKPTLSLDPVQTVVFAKTALPISWISTGTQTIRLFVSYDNLLSSQLIADNVSAAKSLYNYIIKDTVASNCFIIIQSLDNPSLFDTLKQSFSLNRLPNSNTAKYRGGSYDGHSSATNKGKSLVVFSPNKKEQLSANTVFPITWNSISVDKINLQYTIDSGATWLNIATGVSATLSVYNWAVPATPSPRCLVKIIDSANASIFDVSDSVFTIKTNSLNFISPEKNQVFYKGQALQINWTSTGVSRINIDYLDGGIWKSIINGVNASNETFNWKIPLEISDSVELRISDYNDPSAIDTVSKIFIKSSPLATTAKYRGGSYDGFATATNKSPFIILLQPNGNSRLIPLLQYNITWNSNTIINTDIAFSSDSGRTWLNIVTGYPNSQSYLWTVPQIPSTNCLIRIRSSSDSTISDMSDSVFTIVAKSIRLVTDTTIVRYYGTAMPLEWTQLGVEKVSLSYKTSANGSWQTIKDAIASNVEVYNWIVPPVFGNTLWIRIADANEPSVNDEQLFNGVFKSLAKVLGSKYRGGSFDGHSFRSTNNTIKIYRPAANDTIATGSTFPITWQAGNVTDSISLQYSLDSGATWNSIGNAPAISQQYNWAVPLNPGHRSANGNRSNSTVVSSNCIVRAIDKNSSSEIVGVSNKTFSIVQSGTLPVTIISFTGKVENGKAVLSWMVENEITLNNYVIERSFNGIIFQKAGEVNAANLRNYGFTDTANISGKRTYYRLKKVDRDGGFDYSSVVTFNLPMPARFTIYPNPAKTYVQIQMNRVFNGVVNVVVTDIEGKVVQQKTVTSNALNIKINTANLSPGTYVFKIKYKDEEYAEKVIIIR